MAIADVLLLSTAIVVIVAANTEEQQLISQLITRPQCDVIDYLVLSLVPRNPNCTVATDMVCPRKDITFWLYTRRTRFTPTRLEVDMLDTVVWAEGPLKILVHGYTASKDTALSILRPEFDPSNPFHPAAETIKGIAKVVDVYHSNVGVRGQLEPSGDIDVYFNNAEQPGCDCECPCSHFRCVEYYVESISSPMVAFPCGGFDNYLRGECPVPTPGDLVVVGEHLRTGCGSYLLFTAPWSPFFLPDSIYTNEVTFFSFQKTLISSGQCRLKDITTFIESLK